MARIDIIRDELTNDPAGVGYSGLNDQQAAEAMNAINQSVRSDVIFPRELFELIPSDLVVNLQTTPRAKYDVAIAPVYSIQEGVSPTTLDSAIAELFPALSASFTAATTVLKSRSQIRGLGSVNTAEITEARA